MAPVRAEICPVFDPPEAWSIFWDAPRPDHFRRPARAARVKGRGTRHASAGLPLMRVSTLASRPFSFTLGSDAAV